ncbi:MAG: D-aminoacyl-tRNA deacylase, partial [Thermoguttaceae bacterium]
VAWAKVTLKETGEVTGQINKGVLVLLGVKETDTEKDAEFLAKKIASLRIFEDEAGKMNVGLDEIAGEMLIVSQFTLYGDCRKGRRPSFVEAARPEKAVPLYEHFVSEVQKLGIRTACGVFQQEMSVELANDGPVTLWLESIS